MASETIDTHLERGWLLLEEGKLVDALAAAKRALKSDPEAAEAHSLAGAVAAAQGELEPAMESFAKAAELDPDFVEPLLLGAETQLELGDVEGALEWADRALEAADEEEDYLDALLLKADIQLIDGDPSGAKETLAELPPVDLPEPVHHMRAGMVLIDAGDLDAAEKHLDSVLARLPESPDALHALGRIAGERGDSKKQIELWQRVRQLDLQLPSPPWTVSSERFEELVDEVLGHLPERARTLLGNVPIVAADYPSESLVNDGVDPRLLGLFAGTPFPEQQSFGLPPVLENVHLFQRNIEASAQSVEDVEDEITITLMHEIGHFFGLDEEDLAAMGLD